jgi:hypothetical protein
MDAKHGDLENTKGLSSEAARKQIRQQAIERKKLEKWATDRVKPWSRELRVGDYNFRDWATGATKNCLVAGGVYEYARESRKLRGLLVFMNPKRPRETWEMVRPALISGKRPDPNDPFAQAMPIPCSFQNLDERRAERALGGFLYALAELSDYLADNISFHELFRSKRDELEKAFGGLDKLSRVKRERRYFYPIISPAHVATASKAEDATVREVLGDTNSERTRIILSESRSEVIAFEIRWLFTDSEIAKAVAKILRSIRPKSCKPIPRRKRRQESPQSALDALSAMRLASYVRKTSAASDRELASFLSGELRGTKFEPSAIGLFEIVRLGGRGKRIAESNFDALIVKARDLFRLTYPFGEDAENAPTLAERIMTKPKRDSS